PWSDQPLPFKEAAEKGTEKVISDHSTIGIIVTADGSFTDIPRENYIPAEEKSVAKLKELGKPFTIVLNSADPRGEKCRELAEELKQKYGAPVVALNALTDGEEKFNEVMESVLYGFPLKTADIDLPDWLKAMPPESKVIGEIIEAVKRAARKAESMRDCSVFEEETAAVEKIIPEKLTVYAGEGRAKLLLAAEKSLFYDVLSEAAGENIDGEYKLMRLVSDLSEKKKQYERVGEAVEEARATGYGVVVPDFSDMTVGEPELVRKGTGYTVRITAEAESMHLVKVSVRGRVNPLSGTKKQCEDFLEYLKAQTEEAGAVNANIFGRPLNRLVSDEMNMKASAMPADTRKKVRRSVAKMVNEGKYKIFYIVY
ncbi:MAG: stage IV sporulation protein A, partial [Clostridia bacterium]|nr:stage IV sporulation protein A [Clostridia bacterium]